MSTHELVGIWKKEVNNRLPAYYKSELEKEILSKNKKTFRSIHSTSSLVFLSIGVSFFVGILFFVLLYITTNKLVILYLIALTALFLYGVYLWVRSYRKINNDTREKTLKEWLRYRINEIEKKGLPEKENYVSHVISFIVILTVCIIFHPSSIIIVILIYAQFLYNNRKLRKQLRQFKRLYELIEKEEPEE